MPNRTIRVAALAAVLVLTGCGGDNGESVAVTGGADALAAAAGATAATSFVVDIETEVEFTDVAEGDTQTTTGRVVRNDHQVAMEMEMPTPVADLTMHYVLGDDARQFLRYDGMPPGSPIPDGWIELTDPPESSATAVMSSATVDSFLTAFQRDGADVEDLGSTTRDGRTLRRFHTTADLSASVRVETGNRVFGKVMDAMADSMSEVDTDIEVDEDGRIVRITYRNETAAGRTTSIMTLTRFGQAPAVETPEPDEVMTFDEFADLVYPPTPASSEDVDESDLVDRDVFVEALTGDGGLSDELAGCVYDELKASNPQALVEESYESGVDRELASAMTSAAVICGAGG